MKHGQQNISFSNIETCFVLLRTKATQTKHTYNHTSSTKTYKQSRRIEYNHGIESTINTRKYGSEE
jgi:hypothetical protein